jgi:hypothetical protein
LQATSSSSSKYSHAPAVDDIEDEDTTHQPLKKPSRSRGKSGKGKKDDKEEQPEDIDLDEDKVIEKKKGRRLALSGSNSSLEGLSKGIPACHFFPVILFSSPFHLTFLLKRCRYSTRIRKAGNIKIRTIKEEGKRLCQRNRRYRR